MLLAALAIIVGFAVLVWSADRFIDGAAATAAYAGMPSLLIGMVIVGFGTSAPEMVVSAFAALDGNPELALGNAIGSNITNTGLILGVTAVIAPIVVHSKIIRKELPLLIAISLGLGVLLWNDNVTRAEGTVLLVGFFSLMAWTVFSAMRGKGDALEHELEEQLDEKRMPLGRALFWLVFGLVLLLISSRTLVWGAVTIAQALGVSDLIIGLTIVALGTSLPELAASVIAVRKNEHDIAIGNVVGSNMFNILAVVGIAGVIHPMSSLSSEVMTRDWPVMLVFTATLFILAFGLKGQGRINRFEGTLLLMGFVAYNAYLIATVTGAF